MTLVWPVKTLAPRDFEADIDPRTISGGASLAGDEVVVATDAGRWRVALIGVPLTTGAQQRCWDAIAARMGGRANSIAVPLGKWMTAPWPLQANGSRKQRGTPWFSDGATFSDGARFAQALVVATIRAAAARATTVTIDLVDGQDIEAGHIFGIGLDRAHKVLTVSKAGSVFTCTITPPLRAAVTLGTPLDFDDPRVKCRLASDDGMRSARELARFASPSVEFIEVL